MPDSGLDDAERRFLAELSARGVEYAILSAALLQGATLATQDIS